MATIRALLPWHALLSSTYSCSKPPLEVCYSMFAWICPFAPFPCIAPRRQSPRHHKSIHPAVYVVFFRETSFTARALSLGFTFDTPVAGSSKQVPLADALKRKRVPRLHACMQTHVSHSVDSPSHYVVHSCLLKSMIVLF